MEILIFVALTATVFGLVGRLPEPRKVRRELARAKIQTIASLVEGKVAAVRGTVELTDGAFVVSPLTERRCAYYVIVFDEVGAAGDHVELGRLAAGVPFLLRSQGGTARVVPDRPAIAVPPYVVARPFAQAELLWRLARCACRPPNYTTSWLRATEYALVPDQLVTVSGWCTREPDPDAREDVAGYREHLPTRPVLSGSRRAKLLIG